MLVSGWSDGPGYPDVIFGIPMNFVRLRRDFGQRGPSAHGVFDSIRGPPENPKGGAGAPSALPLTTSLVGDSQAIFQLCMYLHTYLHIIRITAKAS